MKTSARIRMSTAFVVAFCVLLTPLTAFAKKGERYYKKGLEYEAAQQWEQSAEQFTLALAANPSDIEYQLHYRRATFNASQALMQRGRALMEQKDFLGAYNSFRQAYAYDQVNELALSEMNRALRMQREKIENGNTSPENSGTPGIPNAPKATAGNAATMTGTGVTIQQTAYRPDGKQDPPRIVRVKDIIRTNTDLKYLIRELAGELDLNVLFDPQSFRSGQTRTIDLSLKNVTAGQALDFVFLQENLFFQKLGRRTIIVADQNRRVQFQELVLRTFYLANVNAEDVKAVIQAAIPPSPGRPQPVALVDKVTNSLTVRDTSENVRLITDLIASLDKSRAEVVMDVQIYEISKSDLFQLGNQIGTGSTINLGGSPGIAVRTGNSTLDAASTGVNIASLVGGAPTALAAALIVPASQLTAFQSKDRSKLLASTQIHAFNGEPSQARIGQRVPVQTASAFPFGYNQTGTGTGTNTGNVFPGGGYPVIQYEPIGLTLNFTPQVFPNLDVQVKMKIESKDVLNASSLTPIFTERTIEGTARIQNNRTMLLASVAQDNTSNGRRGLPFLGLIPVLGRFFSSPTTNNSQVDIVIAVTPRVLRAAEITPDDLLVRGSGTQQGPPSYKIDELVRDAEEEETQLALAAARRNPQATTAVAVNPAVTNAIVTVAANNPANAAAQPAYVPTSIAANNPAANNGNAAVGNVPANTPTTANPGGAGQLNVTQAVATLVGGNNATPTSNPGTNGANVNPLSLNTAPPSDYYPITVEVGNPSTPQVKSSVPVETTDTGSTAPAAAFTRPTANIPANPAPATVAAANSAKVELTLQPVAATAATAFRVGARQRIALTMKADVLLNSALVRLQFDPRALTIRGITTGETATTGAQPLVRQSIDPSGVVVLSLTPAAGTTFKAGETVVLAYLEIEPQATGEINLTFDEQNSRFGTTDGRNLALQTHAAKLLIQ